MIFRENVNYFYPGVDRFLVKGKQQGKTFLWVLWYHNLKSMDN